jgi:hypothetical protein
MKVFAFDKNYVGSNGMRTWKKVWSSLGEIEVHPCNDDESRHKASNRIAEIGSHEPTLLMVHQQCEDLLIPVIDKLHASCPKLFVIYVNGGAQRKVDEPSKPRMHYSRRTVPSGEDLSALKAHLSTLCKALEVCDLKPQLVKLAWSEWDNGPIMVWLFDKLSSLIQHPRDEALSQAVALKITREMSAAERDRAASQVLSRSVNDSATLAFAKLINAPKGVDGDSLRQWLNMYPDTLAALVRASL